MAKIIKRKDKWIFDHYVGPIRKRPSFQTRDEAETYKREFLLRSSGLIGGVGSVTVTAVDAAILEYFDKVSMDKKSATGERRYFKVLLQYLERHEGVGFVHEVDLRHLQGLQRYLQQEIGLSNSTINRYFNTYRAFFETCRKWKYPPVSGKMSPRSRKSGGEI